MVATHEDQSNAKGAKGEKDREYAVRQVDSQVVFVFRATITTVTLVQSCLPLPFPLGTFSMLVCRTEWSSVEQLSIFLPGLDSAATG